MDLKELLINHHIDIRNWSHNLGTKTVDDLQGEIDCGESRIEVVGGNLRRLVRVAGVWVYVRLGDQIFRVVEDKQIFFTGAIRKRQLSQLTEKIHPHESPLVAGKRLLVEELGFDGEVNLVALGQEIRQMVSSSYPGLDCHYDLFNYEVFLNPSDLSRLRFAEVQKQKICLFTLERCSNSAN